VGESVNSTYDKLKNKTIKIVFLDGTKINVITGIFLEFMEEYKQILIIDDRTQSENIIAISQIQKLEVQN
jgi:hypothetical protein